MLYDRGINLSASQVHRLALRETTGAAGHGTRASLMRASKVIRECSDPQVTWFRQCGAADRPVP